MYYGQHGEIVGNFGQSDQFLITGFADNIIICARSRHELGQLVGSLTHAFGTGRVAVEY